ncbi:MAG: PTS glucose transporter subunit IIA [Telmatospirillum sp.]|nr:PTS glucose transporter subunit IIA [Telmatospirillum sp.]
MAWANGLRRIAMEEDPAPRPVAVGAPLAGWVTSLSDLPDPVYSRRMLGDGLVIDPFENVLRAPVDGIVLQAPPDGYAVVLRLANGAQLLMHVGLETHKLAGEGFRLHVARGQSVAAGERLISFDMDLVARRARTVQIPVVVLGQCHRLLSVIADREVTRGDVLFSIAE